MARDSECCWLSISDVRLENSSLTGQPGGHWLLLGFICKTINSERQGITILFFLTIPLYLVLFVAALTTIFAAWRLAPTWAVAAALLGMLCGTVLTFKLMRGPNMRVLLTRPT
jgi:membrane associated rhomboid family serine protease